MRRCPKYVPTLYTFYSWYFSLFILKTESFDFHYFFLWELFIFHHFSIKTKCWIIISFINLNLLSAVFKAVVMLSESSIHFRQKFINLISYVKRGRLPCYVRVQQIPIITSDWLRKTEREIWSFIYLFTYTILH